MGIEIPRDDELDLPASCPRTWQVLTEGMVAGLHLGGQIYVSRGGRTWVHAAFGWARQGMAMRREHRVVWLSAGKPLTAVAFLQQVERGRVGLATPVRELVPEFGVRGKENVTFCHLLTHTAGIRSADQLPAARTWEQSLAVACEAPLEPDWIVGRMAGYQLSATWLVLAEGVQRLTRVPFADHVAQSVLAPLGMGESALARSARQVAEEWDRFAWLHVSQGGGLTAHPYWSTPTAYTMCQPGASAVGPIRDLGRFYEALLNGGQGERGRVLEAPSVGRMIARRREGLEDRTFKSTIDWGLGVIVNSARYGRVPYGFAPGLSEAAFGHGGAQSSIGFADPVSGWVVAWHLNGQCGEPRHQRRNDALHAALASDLGVG